MVVGGQLPMRLVVRNRGDCARTLRGRACGHAACVAIASGRAFIPVSAGNLQLCPGDRWRMPGLVVRMGADGLSAPESHPNATRLSFDFWDRTISAGLRDNTRACRLGDKPRIAPSSSARNPRTEPIGAPRIARRPINFSSTCRIWLSGARPLTAGPSSLDFTGHRQSVTHVSEHPALLSGLFRSGRVGFRREAVGGAAGHGAENISNCRQSAPAIFSRWTTAWPFDRDGMAGPLHNMFRRPFRSVANRIRFRRLTISAWLF